MIAVPVSEQSQVAEARRAAAGREAVLERLLDVRDAGALVLEGEPHAAPAALRHGLDAHSAAPAVVERVAGEFARGGHDLGLVHEAEARGDGARPDLLAHPHHVVGGADLEDRRRFHAGSASSR